MNANKETFARFGSQTDGWLIFRNFDELAFVEVMFKPATNMFDGSPIPVDERDPTVGFYLDLEDLAVHNGGVLPARPRAFA